ncbi:hypothetical protein [Lacticaseibacillus porcinae]|uniref:hypothetical protein n=1 Tax=Lacticaseibacillus porcinae TaxID=1123687 RepID=UPI000F775197|nr:hypothetical protein [Lacticaseibacillus porcinae]
MSNFDDYQSLKAHYPQVADATDCQWALLAKMQATEWPLPTTFPTDSQFSLAALFLPDEREAVLNEPTPAVTKSLADFSEWLREVPLEYGWYEDSPMTDEEYASEENQVDWQEFAQALHTTAQTLCDEIFGPGLPAMAASDNFEIPTEEEWPLLSVLAVLKTNHQPYWFMPDDVLAPQRSGVLHVAGLALPYDLPDWQAGLPTVKLDYIDYHID